VTGVQTCALPIYSACLTVFSSIFYPLCAFVCREVRNKLKPKISKRFYLNQFISKLINGGVVFYYGAINRVKQSN